MPRGLPFKPSNDTAHLNNKKRLLRVADLYAYDLTTPVARANLRTFEYRIANALQDMSSISSKYLFVDQHFRDNARKIMLRYIMAF